VWALVFDWLVTVVCVCFVQDVKHRMTEKWEKKITKIQAEMSKTMSQMNALNLKNVALREKIANASNFRDQVGTLSQ